MDEDDECDGDGVDLDDVVSQGDGSEVYGDSTPQDADDFAGAVRGSNFQKGKSQIWEPETQVPQDESQEPLTETLEGETLEVGEPVPETVEGEETVPETVEVRNLRLRLSRVRTSSLGRLWSLIARLKQPAMPLRLFPSKIAPQRMSTQ